MSYQGPIEEMFPNYKWPINVLRPLKSGNFVTRNSVALLLLSAALGASIRLVITPLLYNGLLLGSSLLLLFVELWRHAIRERVEVTEKGILLQNFWITRKLLKWNEIAEAALQTDEDGKKQFVIGLDTDWSRANTTGMQDTTLILTEEIYGDAIERFKSEFELHFKQQVKERKTLNERFRKQVRNAWQNRNKRALLNIIDNFTLAIYYTLIIDITTRGLLGFTFGILVYSVLNGIYLLIIIVVQMLARPYSIVGFRPNEVEALQYLPDDVITNTRFITMCMPYPLELQSCEMIYNGEHYGQTSRFVQIHPQEIPAGELKLGVGQVTGNHVKADGVKIVYKMQDQEFTSEIYFH